MISYNLHNLFHTKVLGSTCETAIHTKKIDTLKMSRWVWDFLITCVLFFTPTHYDHILQCEAVIESSHMSVWWWLKKMKRRPMLQDWFTTFVTNFRIHGKTAGHDQSTSHGCMFCFILFASRRSWRPLTRYDLEKSQFYLSISLNHCFCEMQD